MAADAHTYGRMQREFYNRRAVTKEVAEGLVHPDYDLARSWTIPSLSWVLLDYAARSSVLPERQTFDSVIACLSRLPHQLSLLDFGCGPGRLMEPLAGHGFRVDGVDISDRMMSFARQKAALADSQFYLSTGRDCGAAPSGSYDIVYSQLCLQHIATRAVRNEILASMAESLKDDGMVSIQLNYYPDYTAEQIPPPHVPWDADDFDARGTNSQADVWITPEQLHLVLHDFRRWFRDVRLQFVEFPEHLAIFNHAYGTWLDNIIVSGTKGYSLYRLAGQPCRPE